MGGTRDVGCSPLGCAGGSIPPEFCDDGLWERASGCAGVRPTRQIFLVLGAWFGLAGGVRPIIPSPMDRHIPRVRACACARAR